LLAAAAALISPPLGADQLLRQQLPPRDGVFLKNRFRQAIGSE
jgi:hypothetical protein